MVVFCIIVEEFKIRIIIPDRCSNVFPVMVASNFESRALGDAEVTIDQGS